MSAGETIKQQEHPRRYAGCIHLARHGKPDLSRRKWLTRKGYRDWWADYGKVGLLAGQTPPPELVALGKKAALILASPLPRASKTADLLAGDRGVETDPMFSEAPLPAPFVLPFLKTPPPVWGFLSRVSWLLGYSDGGESRYQAEERARRAADRLIELAANERGDILLCGHGWFNHMMGRELKKRGWQVVDGGGAGYWEHTSFLSPV